MKQGSLAGTSVINKFFIIAGFVIGSIIITNILGLILATTIFGFSLGDILNIIGKTDYENHTYVNALKILQIIESAGMFVIPPILAAYFFGRKGENYLKTNTRSSLINYIFAVIIIIFCMPLIDWMGYVNSGLKLPQSLAGMEHWMKDAEQMAAEMTKAFLNVMTFKGLLINILMIAILPAIGEEFVFRGLLLRYFRNWTKNKHVAIIITAILFSAIHMQFYGFVPRMMLGIILGYLFVWTDCIWVPIAAHFTNNATEVIVSYIQKTGYLKGDLHRIFSWNENYLYLSISIVLSGISIWYLYSIHKRVLISK